MIRIRRRSDILSPSTHENVVSSSSSWFAAILLALGCGEAKVASQVDTSPHNPSLPPGGTADGGFVTRTVIDNGTSYTYSVFLPKGFTTKTKWPIVLALHGSAEKGTDGVKPTTVGLGAVLRAQKSTFPAVVVFPQMPPIEGEGRVIFTRLAIKTLDAAVQEFNGDPSREYLTGLSLGGDIGYVLTSQYVSRFAAFVPISALICDSCVTGVPTATDAMAYTQLAQFLRNTPTWVFQGANDPNVTPIKTRAFVLALKSAGTPITYTEYPNVAHNAWDAAYNSPELFAWLFSKQRTTTTGS
jgi:predicted peptidase